MYKTFIAYIVYLHVGDISRYCNDCNNVCPEESRPSTWLLPRHAAETARHGLWPTHSPACHHQPNGAVAKESKNTPMSCEKSRKELQSLMRILSRIPTRSLVHKFAWVHNYLTHGTAAIQKWQTSVWKFAAKHRLLRSAATLLFAVWCLASSASSERSTESKYLKGSKIVNKCAL